MQEENDTKISPIAAGITGLILGVVGTAAIALSDKDTREKAVHKANDIRDTFKKWSQDTLHDVQSSEVTDGVKEKLEPSAHKLSESVQENKNGEIGETFGSKVDGDI